MASERLLPYAIKSYALSMVFCVAIAVMLSVVFENATLGDNLTISLSIGLCISTSYIFLGRLAEKYLAKRFSSVLLMVFGAMIGIALGSLIVTGNPLTLFAESKMSWILALFFGAIGVVIFSSRDQLIKTQLELSEANANQAAQAQQLAESQLKVLQAQIEPHFLFNTLSNVSSMIHTNPDDAERTLHNLSRLLRHNLQRTREPVTTLGEELDILQAYLEIQKIRMGPRLQFSIETDSTLRAQPLPPMLLQPLVENAVQHGIEPAEDGGELRVNVRLDNEFLELQVTDTGLGMQTTSSGSGTGLRNIRERLHGLYQGRASLTLCEREPRGIEATLLIPTESA